MQRVLGRAPGGAAGWVAGLRTAGRWVTAPSGRRCFFPLPEVVGGWVGGSLPRWQAWVERGRLAARWQAQRVAGGWRVCGLPTGGGRGGFRHRRFEAHGASMSPSLPFLCPIHGRTRVCRDAHCHACLSVPIALDVQEEKMRIPMSRGGRAWRGFFPVGGELTSGKPDMKEVRA